MNFVSMSLYDPRLRSGSFIPRTMCYYDRPDMLATTDAHRPPHRHNMVEIMYVTLGRARIRFKGRDVDLESGQMILIDNMAVHALELFDGEACAMLNIEFAFVESDNEGLSLRNLAVRHQPLGEMLAVPLDYRVVRDDDGVILRLLKQTVAISDSVHAQSIRLASMLTDMILMSVAAKWKALQANQPATRNQYVDKIKRLIDACDLCEPMSVASLASAAGISPGYLIKLFKDEFRLTPGRYILLARLREAKRLLETTDYSIIHIAAAVGLTSERYFSRLFKRETGVSPSAYRAGAGEAAPEGSALWTPAGGSAPWTPAGAVPRTP